MDEYILIKIKKAAEALKAAGAKEVFVFGSVVTGQVRHNSDIDLAVSGLPPEKYYSAMSVLDVILKCPYDLVDLDEDNPFVRHLKSENVLKNVA